MYQLKIGIKGLLEAVRIEKECGDIGAGCIEPVYKAFNNDNKDLMKFSGSEYTDRIIKTAKEGKNKEISDLSEDEKFCICFMAGAEIEFYHFDEVTQSFNPRTRFPCDIKKEDGKFFIIEGR